MTRTWTALIEPRTSGRALASIPAADSEADLLRDQLHAGIRDAVVLLDDADSVDVVLLKTTKAGGTRRDRRFSVYRDKHGDIRYSGPYAG